MSLNRQVIRNAPHTAGVYSFRAGDATLYIGKAANLQKRLVSYFRANASDKVRRLVGESDHIDWIESSSEAEAFIAEAEMIKKHQPKFNVLMRDDKNYFYVGITRQEFPRVFITHQPAQIRNSNIEIRNKFKIQNSKPVSDFGFRASDFPRYIGPFTSGSALKTVLRLLRKIFPYCTCKKPHARPCLNSQIGRCMGYCCRKQETANSEQRTAVGAQRQREEYKKIISGLAAVLSGKKKQLAGELRREMRRAARGQDFEAATRMRDQVEGLENIFSHTSVLRERPAEQYNAARLERGLRALFGGEHAIRRAEAYDIANIAGEASTGSMVVFLDGKPAKSEYRIFNIKTVQGISDVAMIQEVVSRRLRHPEWQYPDLMIIDGGKPQLNAALAAARSWELGVGSQKVRSPNSKLQTKIYVTALAKREEELYFPNKKFPIRLIALPPEIAHFFQRIRDEAHRFARKQHHKLRSRALRP